MVCIPTVFSVVDSYPKIGVIGIDKLNRDMFLFLGVNVVPSIRVSMSLVFKVCVLCDIYREIILLSPINLFIVVSEFSDKNYCCQGVLVLSCVSRIFEESLTYVKAH